MPTLTCAVLIDDDQTTNFLNQLLLKRISITDKVLVALNGKEALELVQQHCQHATAEAPALVLLDIKMPVMNGFQFLEALGQLPGLRSEAIILAVLTTSLHAQDVERVQQLHIPYFLSKPLTQAKIEQVLADHSARVAAQHNAQDSI